MKPSTTASFCRKFPVRRSVTSALHPLSAPRSPHTPSLPDARPGSDRFRCGGRESKFLAVSKTLLTRALALLLLVSTTALHAQVPQLINYQGRVAVGTVNFDGSGLFKFALVNTDGTATFWSNDGTSISGSQPTAAVTLTVTKGLYSVLLGNATLPNMAVVPATVFTNPDVRLRVWFNDGTNGFQLMTPDQRIAAVGYAMMATTAQTAQTVPDGAITSAKIAAGAVGNAQIAANAVQSSNIAVGAVSAAQLADGTITAAKMADATITPDKMAKPVRTGSVASSSLAMDPTGASLTVSFSPAFGTVPNVTLSMDAADGTVPGKARLTLTSRTAAQFTARISNGTSAPLTAMPQAITVAANVQDNSTLAVVNGNPAVCYQESNVFHLGYVRANDANGTTWGTAITVDSTVKGDMPSLTLVNGNPAVSYFDSTNGRLKYVRANDVNGITWGTPVTVDSSGSVGRFSSLTVINGNPAISYHSNTSSSVKYVRATDANGTSWGTPLTVDSASFVSTSLLTVNGNPAISYLGTSTGKYVRANDANGTAWGTPVAVGNGLAGSMAIVNGNPAICSNADPLYARANDANGTTWGALVTLPAVGGSLVVINGYPAIFGSNATVPYMRAVDANGAVWSDFVSFNSINSRGSMPALALVNGQPAVVSNNGQFIRAGAPLPFNVLWMALEP